MIKKFSFIKTLPAYALGVCLALSCNTVEPQFADPAPVREIGFVPTESQLPGTKGIPVASDNIATLYADNVRIVAFRGRNEYIPSQRLLSPSGENPLWHTSERYFWPESGSLDFWAWAPADIFTFPRRKCLEGGYKLHLHHLAHTGKHDGDLRGGRFRR